MLSAIKRADLSERHARALLRLKSEPEKMSAISVISSLGMSVSRAEQYIDKLLNPDQKNREKPVNLGGFLNNLSQNIARIQSAGISAVSERRETEKEIVLTITIPK